MSGWLGDFPEDYTAVVCMFTTHDANGAPVAPLSAFEVADFKIYKDGGSGEKTTTNGVTMTSPFDAIVGLHTLTIDTSNDTGDAAFWVAGHLYTIVLNPDTETVNGQTALKVLGQFGIALVTAGGGAAPTAAAVAAAVWDLARSGHATSGTFGEGVASVQGDVTGSVGSVSGAVGSVGGNVDGNVAGSIGSVAAGGIAAASFAAGAIDATAIADNAIDAGAIATDALTSAKFATGALDAVWSTTTRLLTAGTNIILAKGVGVTGFNDPTADNNADALLDRTAGVETSRTVRQSLRLMLAAMTGKASGLAGTTATFRDTNDTKNRIVATVDSDGNRSSVTLDAS